MEAYNEQPAESNPFPTLVYATPRWTLAQRKGKLRDRNPRHTTGKGTKRRDAAEFKIGDALTWLAALVHGTEGVTTRRGKPLRIARGLYERLGRVTPGLWDLRKKIRARVSWLVENGPASGWALANEGAQGEPYEPLTPYYVPRGSRDAAEKWVRFGRRVYQLVELFAALRSKVSPAQRAQLRENGEDGKTSPVLSRSVETSTGFRAHVPPIAGPAPPGRAPCECAACQDSARFLRATASARRPVEAEAWYQRALARSETTPEHTP